MLGIAVPNFVWGLLLIVVFGAILQLLPVSGRIAPEYEAAEVTGSAVVDVLLRRDTAALGSVLAHLILPASALALPLLAAVFRTIRSDLLGALGEEYVVTERMKGLGEARILFWRALRNALIPTTTLIGVQFGFLIGGTVLIETIFGVARHRAADAPGVPVPGLSPDPGHRARLRGHGHPLEPGRSTWRTRPESPRPPGP